MNEMKRMRQMNNEVMGLELEFEKAYSEIPFWMRFFSSKTFGKVMFLKGVLNEMQRRKE